MLFAVIKDEDGKTLGLIPLAEKVFTSGSRGFFGQGKADHDGERLQPVYALIPASLRDSLDDFLASGERKIDLWYARHRMATADFSDRRDHFLNLNRPDELAQVERLLRRPES